VNQAKFKNGSSRELKLRLSSLFCVLAWLLVSSSAAQDSGSAVQHPDPFAQNIKVEGLPATNQLAAALSDPTARMDILMTMTVMAQALEDAALTDPGDAGSLEARFRDERAWLDRLATRFSGVPLRGAVLDVSAWFFLKELNQHEIIPSPLVSPLGAETHYLLQQVFDRSNERLAAAFLPELLMRMEPLSPLLWDGFLTRASEDEAFLNLVSSLDVSWFEPWLQNGSPALIAREPDDDPIALALLDFQALAASALLEGAPDPRRLQRLRHFLLSALPEMSPVQARDAAHLLRLAAAIDGLQDRKYLAFTETLLWLVSDLLLTRQESEAEEPFLAETGDEVSGIEPGLEDVPLIDSGVEEAPVQEPVKAVTEGVSAAELATGEAEGELAAVLPGAEELQQPRFSELPRVLSELLPQLSNAYAREFSDVDPRINASLAAAFDVVQYLQEGTPGRKRYTTLLRELADAAAQFALLMPNMNFYFDQPVRRRIAEEIDICTSIAAATDSEGNSTLSREQFDRCLASMVELAESSVNSAELAGDPDGPFGAVQLQRELELTPWQRINYALGYLHDTYSSACEAPEEPLPNPLEWSALTTTLSWFASQSPVYFQTPENEALIVRMRQQGMELLQAMEQQVDCFSGAGGGINDPVSLSMLGYRQILEELVAGIRETELSFRETRLAPGADIVLKGGANQNTAYRPEGMIIGPCNPEKVCEMTGDLEATRALIGLFPDHYLIADQSGLGKIEICYDNMQWVQRRAEPVREDDPHVANYFGRLSFTLIGRYIEAGTASNVFGSNFITPDEYHYLFAAASDEVLDDSCPTEWVGSKIVTPLNTDARIRVVPDRLTYLAAAREQPSRIINLNWSRGSEWRDWFVTGLGITRLEFEADESILSRIDQHLQALYLAEQTVLYRALLRPPGRGGVDESISLYDEMNAITTAKTLLRTQMNLFYPDFLIDSDEIRASLEGSRSLIDGPVLRRFRDGNVPIESINEVGISRFEEFRKHWSRQPASVRRSGSVAISVAHAIARLNTLYIEFFALAPEPVDQNESKSRFSGFRG